MLAYLRIFVRGRSEKLADAHRLRTVLEAEAEAEAIRLNGEAQAFAIEAKAKAEAEQMSKKAAAFKEYREAAMVDMLLNTLPKVCLLPWVLRWPFNTKNNFFVSGRCRSRCSYLPNQEDHNGGFGRRRNRRCQAYWRSARYHGQGADSRQVAHWH